VARTSEVRCLKQAFFDISSLIRDKSQRFHHAIDVDYFPSYKLIDYTLWQNLNESGKTKKQI